MKCSAIVNALFLNLIIFCIGSYMYLVYTQYWFTPPKQDSSAASSYDKQIYLYNRGYLPKDSSNKTEAILLRSKHELKGNITYITNSRPRLPSYGNHKFQIDTKKYRCIANETKVQCDLKTSEFKTKLLMELRNIFVDEGNILKSGNLNNTYNVHYAGPREDFRTKTSSQVLCELLNTKLETLKRSDIDGSDAIKSAMPKRGFFENKYFNSCAVVASAGALKESNLGKFIDSHDVVLRFNHAPTERFAQDVGSKTTVRVVNSQVVTKPQFRFVTSSMYKNINLIVWDPSNYSASLEEWLKRPEHNLFPNFVRYRKQEPKPRIFMINPSTVWDVWDFLQRNSPNRLRKNPPSSGFLGLRLLLPHCNFVDVVEYVPSTRVTKKCHYFDPDENPACTFGVWHPLAAEKLLTYHINEASDYEVFQKGYVRIKGFRNLKC